MKRPNGTGSIIKLSGNRRKPWAICRTIGYKPDGKRIVKYDYYESRILAMKAIDSNPLMIIENISKENMTLNNIFAEWQAIHYKNISESLIKSYNLSFNYLKSLHKTKFVNLRTATIQNAIDIMETGRRSKEIVKTLMTQLYKYAIQNDIVNKNYAEFIILPKKEISNRDAFTQIEIEKLWNAYNDGIIDAELPLALIYTGFRLNELLSLNMFNFNFDENVITGGSKTEAGRNRKVVISTKILPFIKRRASEGTFFDYTQKVFRAKYYDVLETMKIRKLSPHCCRHTTATLLVSSGVDPTIIKSIMGHSDFSTTVNLYTHIPTKDIKNAIEKI